MPMVGRTSGILREIEITYPIKDLRSEATYSSEILGADQFSAHTVAMIRTATIEDVPKLIQFLFELADFEHLSHTVTLDPDRLREHLFGPTPCIEALIAEADGDPVGFALFYTNYSTFQCRPGLYLEDLYIQPAFRGRGLGRALLLSVARLSVARHCGRMEWAVLDWNQQAIGFYQSLGAHPLDDWTKYRLSGDALLKAASLP
ncbi:GNAT family N-acetyltransferase [Schlesneria paludicola]|uniref:GNAT family N-acetyltransferase n=1 Tax=Schlesneria paludicola TaxID=360056 RepID=UPI00029B4F39|nr:GNAT family N-acetyltransferase [Schlesneria paludicola]